MPDRRAFPDFLRPAFAPEALEQGGNTVAVIDANGAILWVNSAWRRFAEENGGEGVDGILTYFDGIAHPLGDYYRAVLTRALATGTPFEQDYECSSPGTRRLFHLRALPVAREGLVLEHSLLVEEPLSRAAEAPGERYFSAEGLLSQCGNCRRIREPATLAWHWVPAWVDTPQPNTSHVICPTCEAFYWGFPHGV